MISEPYRFLCKCNTPAVSAKKDSSALFTILSNFVDQSGGVPLLLGPRQEAWAKYSGIRRMLDSLVLVWFFGGESPLRTVHHIWKDSMRKYAVVWHGQPGVGKSQIPTRLREVFTFNEVEFLHSGFSNVMRQDTDQPDVLLMDDHDLWNLTHNLENIKHLKNLFNGQGFYFHPKGKNACIRFKQARVILSTNKKEMPSDN